MHYLTFSCYQRLPLFAIPATRDAFVEAIVKARQRHRFLLLAWVIMPEHVHLILVPTVEKGPTWPEGHGSPVRTILSGLKRPFAAAVLAGDLPIPAGMRERLTDADGVRHFWQPGGGYDRNVRDARELAREIRYVHKNPVRRGLADAVIDWRWSSAQWYGGQTEQRLSIDSVLFGGYRFPGKEPARLLQ